jgi:hypothetical protein
LLPHAFVFAFRRRKIASLSDCLAASCGLLVAEVILWTLSLID